MQSNSMGVDRILDASVDLGNIVLTCSRGVYADETAEHAVALVLALLRGLHDARDQQQARRWTRRRLRTLHGARVLVLGWGSIGQGIGRRLTALGAAVEAVRRRQDEPRRGDGVTSWGPHGWRGRLSSCDVLVLALPLTSHTRHLVDASVLAALPPGAFVVNVGRGGTLDERALVTALESHRLAGAALDVLEQEPPAATDALWSIPGLLITPHVARSCEESPYRWEPLFVENLRRFANDEPLLNVVDRTAGY
jgi:phosphoglycerate dehydrogenase-like enzyme